MVSLTQRELRGSMVYLTVLEFAGNYSFSLRLCLYLRPGVVELS